MGVYKEVPYRDALETMGRKPIDVKGVHVLKASGKHRSRLVAKEFKSRGRPRHARPDATVRGGDDSAYDSGGGRRRQARARARAMREHGGATTPSSYISTCIARTSARA